LSGFGDSKGEEYWALSSMKYSLVSTNVDVQVKSYRYYSHFLPGVAEVYPAYTSIKSVNVDRVIMTSCNTTTPRLCHPQTTSIQRLLCFYGPKFTTKSCVRVCSPQRQR